MTPALDALRRVQQIHNDEREKWREAIEQDGHFYWRGRKVLLTYEDTGRPTNDEEKQHA